jgi:drug/metabolite transporter (DMT)-like permease
MIVNSSHRAIALLFVATLFWALSFPLVQVLYVDQRSLCPGASNLFLSLSLMVTRFGLGLILLLPWLIKMRFRFTRREWEQGIILAFCGGMGMWLQADALAYTSASTCAFITQTYCVFLPVYCCILRRRWPSLSLLMATALVMTGMAWLSEISWQDFSLGRGESETLLAAFIFTGQILCLESPRYQENRSLATTWIMFLGIVVMALPAAIHTSHAMNEMWLVVYSLPAALIILTMTLLCSIAAFLLMNRWQRHISAIQAGLIYATEPLFTSVIALFLPAIIGQWMGHSIANETIHASLIGGGLLMTIAVIIAQRSSDH